MDINLRTRDKEICPSSFYFLHSDISDFLFYPSGALGIAFQLDKVDHEVFDHATTEEVGQDHRLLWSPILVRHVEIIGDEC